MDLKELLDEVVGMRADLKHREKIGTRQGDEAKGRLASANERAAMLVGDVFKHKVIDFDGWRIHGLLMLDD